MACTGKVDTDVAYRVMECPCLRKWVYFDYLRSIVTVDGVNWMSDTAGVTRQTY